MSTNANSDTLVFKIITVLSILILGILAIYHSFILANNQDLRTMPPKVELGYEQIYRDILFNSPVKVLIANCNSDVDMIMDASPGMLEFLNAGRNEVIRSGLAKWLDGEAIAQLKHLCATDHYPFCYKMEGRWKVNNSPEPVIREFSVYRTYENQAVAIILNVND